MQSPPPLSSHPYGDPVALPPFSYVSPSPPLPPAPTRTGVERAALTLTIVALPLFYVVTLVNVFSSARPGGMRGLDIVLAAMSVLFDPIPYLLLIGMIQLFRRRPTGVLLALVGVVIPVLGSTANQLVEGGSNSPGPVAAVLIIIFDALVVVTALVATAASTHGPHPRPPAVTAGVGASVFLVQRSATSLAQVPVIVFAMFATRHDSGAYLRPGLGPWLSWHVARESQHRDGLPFSVGLAALTIVLVLSIISIVAGAGPSHGTGFLVGTIGAVGVFIASEAGALVLGASIVSPGDLRSNGGGIDYVVVLLFVITMGMSALTPKARRWFCPSSGAPAEEESSSIVAL